MGELTINRHVRLGLVYNDAFQEFPVISISGAGETTDEALIAAYAYTWGNALGLSPLPDGMMDGSQAVVECYRTAPEVWAGTLTIQMPAQNPTHQWQEVFSATRSDIEKRDVGEYVTLWANSIKAGGFLYVILRLKNGLPHPSLMVKIPADRVRIDLA